MPGAWRTQGERGCRCSEIRGVRQSNCQNAGRVDQIFVRHGKAVEDPNRTAANDRLVGSGRVAHRALRGESDDRIDGRVQTLDLREVRGVGSVKAIMIHPRTGTLMGGVSPTGDSYVMAW